MRKIAADVGTIDKSTVHEFYKKHTFRSLKVHPVHNLNEDDSDRMLQFYETKEHVLVIQQNFFYRKCSSDKVNLFINGSVNRPYTNF